MVGGNKCWANECIAVWSYSAYQVENSVLPGGSVDHVLLRDVKETILNTNFSEYLHWKLVGGFVAILM